MDEIKKHRAELYRKRKLKKELIAWEKVIGKIAILRAEQTPIEEIALRLNNEFKLRERRVHDA